MKSQEGLLAISFAVFWLSLATIPTNGQGFRLAQEAKTPQKTKPIPAVVQRPKDCKAEKKNSRTIKVTCASGPTVYFVAKSGNRLVVQTLQASKPPQLHEVQRSTKDRKGSLTPIDLRPRCLGKAAYCNQHIVECNEDPDRPWIKCPPFIPPCPGVTDADCGNGGGSFDICRALEGACNDNIFGLITGGQLYACLAAQLCGR